jgi:hypothetical protein
MRIKKIMLAAAQDSDIAEQMLSKKAYNEALFRLLKKNSASSSVSIAEIVVGWRQPFYEQAMLDVQGA